MGNGLKSRVKGQEILVFPQTHERKKKKKKKKALVQETHLVFKRVQEQTKQNSPSKKGQKTSTT